MTAMHEDVRRDYERIARKQIDEHGPDANVEINAEALLVSLGTRCATCRGRGFAGGHPYPCPVCSGSGIRTACEK